MADVEHDSCPQAGIRGASAPAVGFEGVSVAFLVLGGDAYRAVAETSLKVAAHEFVAIVGPTGCGKSTLLNVAAGLLAPSTGRTVGLRLVAM